MQITKMRVVAMMLVALSTGNSCRSTASWLQRSDPPFAPAMSERLGVDDVLMLGEGEIGEAIKILEQTSVLELTDINKFPSITQSKVLSPRRLYLVRAEKDDAEGAYSVFQRGNSILVLYSHFGKCGKIRKSALVISSTTAIKNVYGGCSGAL